jgi:hypothetical protein
MSAEDRIAALEAEVAKLKQCLSVQAIRVAALVVHHDMADAAALPDPGPLRPCHLTLVGDR